MPATEERAAAPLSAYGADKYSCELQARIASTVHGVPTVGLRLFNLYGPRQDPRSPYSGVISIFADRLLCGEPIEIFGDGEQTRDFVYIGDGVRALRRAMVVHRRPARLGDVRISIGDPRLAAAQLAFEAKTALSDGLAQTIDELQRRRQAVVARAIA
jgi:UDP-glucose 4-epimerase